jgi:hypothetical protein
VEEIDTLLVLNREILTLAERFGGSYRTLSTKDGIRNLMIAMAAEKAGYPIMLSTDEHGPDAFKKDDGSPLEIKTAYRGNAFFFEGIESGKTLERLIKSELIFGLIQKPAAQSAPETLGELYVISVGSEFHGRFEKSLEDLHADRPIDQRAWIRIREIRKLGRRLV